MSSSAMFFDKAITLHAPWAWAIVQGYKRVENRDWVTPYRGPLLIHSGRSTASDVKASQILETLAVVPPPISCFVRGCIIGVVDLVEIVPLEEYLCRFGGSPLNRGLAVGKYCWVLENPRTCEPFRCPGNFQIWSATRALQRRGENPKPFLAVTQFSAASPSGIAALAECEVPFLR